ncbi:MAG TPA: hypothetical protein P5572_07395 [Phycisphaerae bacterium]|nr:hypothetical protein [Phycisphaerae bacterium]
MTYIKVRWIHSHPDEPVLLYSELNDDRWEVRKIEVYRDGRRGFASVSDSVGDTRLGQGPVPTLAEIAADPQFEPVAIERAEFEAAWRNLGP